MSVVWVDPDKGQDRYVVVKNSPIRLSNYAVVCDHGVSLFADSCAQCQFQEFAERGERR